VTNETNIKLSLLLDGLGTMDGSTGIGFFDHMLMLMVKHGLMDMNCTCKGDLFVDGHHTVEDIGICFGKALKEALGSKESIKRYSTVILPMDEALAMVSLDISGRPYLYFDVDFHSSRVGDFDTELVKEFFRAVTIHGELTLHVKLFHGENTHHIIEAIFKAFGKAVDEAARIDPRIKGIPSSKGVI